MKAGWIHIGIVVTLVCTAALLASAFPIGREVQPAEKQTAAGASTRTPVLVELFTSEGCSSCPPADALLAQLQGRQPIPGARVVALKEHVDYWNRLGWKDPFSSSAYTSRQHAYAAAFGNSTVYTPQMVVDGTAEFVGSSDRRARGAIAEAARSPKADVAITPLSDTDENSLAVALRVEPLATLPQGASAELLLAVTEDNLYSEIKRGENAGLTVTHFAVVRALRAVHRFTPADAANGVSTQIKIALNPAWKRRDLRLVAFVQEQRSRRVLAIGTFSLSPGS
jgi:hypothetical protein